MTYAEKLKKPKWQKKRLEILQRDNFTCKLCGDSESTLHIHHLEYKDYNSDPWDIENDLLITYCEDCHHIVEDILKSNKRKLEFLKTRKVKSDNPDSNDLEIWIFFNSDIERLVFRYYKLDGKIEFDCLISEHQAKRITEIFKEIDNGIEIHGDK